MKCKECLCDGYHKMDCSLAPPTRFRSYGSRSFRRYTPAEFAGVTRYTEPLTKRKAEP